MRADRSALGMLPTAAFQYGEPVCAASAFGWYVFPPAAFHVQWDGTAFVWTHDEGDMWQPLVSEHFPGLPERFDAAAPEDVRGFAPPFLSRVAQPGVLQIWSWLLVRTAPGWSVLVRPPANLPRSQHFEIYEGIIETDRWFSAVFANLRMIKANRPIAFDPTQPLVQCIGSAMSCRHAARASAAKTASCDTAGRATAVPVATLKRSCGRCRCCGCRNDFAKLAIPHPRWIAF